MNKKILVVGASGVNGIAVTSHFADLNDWDVSTLSRSETPVVDGVEHISADLLDADSLSAQAKALSDITHIFYAALKPNEDIRLEADENAQMFSNIIEAVEKESQSLDRVIFLQGGKIYGAHLGVYKTPAKEDDSRHFPPNLYFRHEDYAISKSAKSNWSWTALRPDIVVGYSVGSTMNLGNLIGVYASLCRELDVAFQFPGTRAAYNVLVNVTDSDIVAKAAEWAIDTNANGAFNITNGDVFRWRHTWQKIADYFGLKIGEPQPISLQARLSAMKDVWQKLVEREGLESHSVMELGQGSFGDFIFYVEADAIFDLTKTRQAGFSEMKRRSVDSFIAHFDDMRDRNLIPK